LRKLSCPQHQDHIHPHTQSYSYTRNTLKHAFRPPNKNSARTLGADKKCLLEKILHVLQDSDISQYIFKRHGLCKSIKKEKKDGTHEGPKVLKK
jgi:hypothetical protein